MDKIDKILFRYTREREKCEEVIKLAARMLIPLSAIVIMGIVSMCLFNTIQGWILLGIAALCMLIWARFMDAKWGTKKWKKRIMDANRKGFQANQKKLIEIINEEKMNCQQVYNGLLKKYSRLPQCTEQKGQIITILSLVVALTGILVSPIINVGLENYGAYVIGILVIVAILGGLGYALYRIVNVHNVSYDKKKDIYADALELLEDWLY